MIRVLFVCLGNICRSPIAEATFREIIHQRGLSDHFEADSAGVMGWHTGDLPDKRTRANAAKHGIKLTHQARKSMPQDFDDFLHVVAMDEENFKALHTTFYETKGRIPSVDELFLLRDFDPQRTNASVPDPYYESEEAFEEVFQIVWRSNEALVDHMLEKHQIELPKTEDPLG